MMNKDIHDPPSSRPSTERDIADELARLESESSERSISPSLTSNPEKDARTMTLDLSKDSVEVLTIQSEAISDKSVMNKKRDKQKVEFEGSLSRDEAAAHFEAIARGLAQGTIQLSQAEHQIELAPGHHLEIELKASRKGSKEKLSIELEWKAPSDSPIEVVVDN